MPHQDPVTPPEEPTVGDGPAQDTAIQAQQAPGHEPAAYEEPPAYEPAAEEDIEEGDDWLQEPDELPHRPRRRLLGAANPLALALLGVLLIVCGFIGGVLIEKGQTSIELLHGRRGGRPRLALRGAARRHELHLHLHERSVVQLEQQRRLCPADRRDGGIHRREHAVCDQLRRQHRQGQHLGRHDREQDRESERQRHPPRRNDHRHRCHRLERSAQRRIDQRRLERRRSGGAVRRLGRGIERRSERLQNEQRTHAVRQAVSKQMSLSSG